MQFFQGRLAIKILQSKLFYWCTIPALVLGALIIAYFSSIQDFPVFPNNQNFEYSFYSDSTAGGNSEIVKKRITDRIIQLDFKIGNKPNVSSYVGINIGPKEIKSAGLGRYNQMSIRLKGKGINGIGISLVTKNHFKKSDIKDQDVLFYQIFKISPEVSVYQINVDRFEIPGWWGEVNRFEDASTIKPELKNLHTININSAFTPNDGQIQSIEISSIEFTRNNKSLLVLISALELVFILLVFIVLYTTEKNRENKRIITIAYKPVESKSSETSKSDFIEFMNNNFQNCDLTLDFVSSETGVSQRRITNDVQNQFGCNFKSYINRLRINESKRLLLEKDLNIGEIAFRVGFNNQTHYNRVFKSEMHISPTEYRDKNKKR